MAPGISGDVRRLRKAIERNQLRLEYQPEADMRTGGICGVEALVRWQSPRRGLVPPDEFIPPAERSGATLKALTDWTLEESFRQARVWQLAGHDLTVAVNLSPGSFRDDSLVETIGLLLSKWDAAPSSIQLELTETAVFAIADPERVGSILRELAGMGLLL